jgi:hypothetical protein
VGVISIGDLPFAWDLGRGRGLRGKPQARKNCGKGTPGTRTWNRQPGPRAKLPWGLWLSVPGGRRGEKKEVSLLLPHPPRGYSASLPTGVEDLTIKWRRQILQSEAESQRIAVRKLLNRLQHPGWYVSRLQTIRCGYTACGGYGHLGDATPAFPDVAEFPLHGLRKDGLKPSPKMASQCKPHAISLHCLDGILP